MAGIAAPLMGVVAQLINGIMNQNQQQWNQGASTNMLDFWRQMLGQGMDRYGEAWQPVRDTLLGLLQNPNAPGGNLASSRDTLDSIRQYLTSGPNQFNYNQTEGATQDINDLTNILSRISPQYDQLNNIVNNNGLSPQQQQIFNMIMGNATGTSGMLPTLWSAATNILDNRGQSAMDQTLQQRLVDVANAGGANATNTALGQQGFDLLSRLTGGGFTNPLTQQFTNIGTDLLSQMNNVPSIVQQGANTASQLFSNAQQPLSGMSPAIQQLLNNAQTVLNNANTNQGYTGGINQLQTNAQDLFDRVMSTGGFVSPQFNDVLGQGYNLISGANDIDPLTQRLLGTLSSIGAAGGAISMPSFAGIVRPTGTGTTDWTNYLRERARGLYSGEESPLLSMDEMISLAQDQAGGLTQANYLRAIEQAAARGAIPGSAIGSGGVNRFLGETSNAISQAQAQALREAALSRQQLGLQERQIADALGLGVAGAENQRYGTEASIANTATNANVQRYLGELSSATSRATASQAAQSALAQALAAAGANRYNTAIGGGVSLLNNVLNNAANIFNTGTGNALEALLGGEQVAAGRYNNEITQGLAALLGGANASNDLYSTNANFNLGQINAGTSLLNNAMQGQVNNTQNYLSNILPFLANTNTNEVTQWGNIADTGTNLVNSSLQDQIARLVAYGNIGNAAGQRELDRYRLGLDTAGQYNDMLGNLLTLGGGIGQQGQSNVLNALQLLQGLPGIESGVIGQRTNTRTTDLNNQLNAFGVNQTAIQQWLNNMFNTVGGYGNLGDRDIQLLTTGLQGLGGNAEMWAQIAARYGLQNPFSQYNINNNTNPFSDFLQTAAEGLGGMIPNFGRGNNSNWGGLGADTNISFPTFPTYGGGVNTSNPLIFSNNRSGARRTSGSNR